MYHPRYGPKQNLKDLYKYNQKIKNFKVKPNMIFQ